MRNDVPETLIAVEDAKRMEPLVEKRLVAVSAVDDAYGNVLAMLVDVAMKYGAVGVEVAATVPLALTQRSEFEMLASESAPAESNVEVALAPKYAGPYAEKSVVDAVVVCMLVGVKLVAVRLVTVALVTKRFVEVALVVVAYVAVKLSTAVDDALTVPVIVPLTVRSPVTVVAASVVAPLAESVVAATDELVMEDPVIRPFVKSESSRSMSSSSSMRSAPPTAA